MTSTDVDFDFEFADPVVLVTPDESNRQLHAHRDQQRAPPKGVGYDVMGQASLTSYGLGGNGLGGVRNFRTLSAHTLVTVAH